jgi:hypothetical protein
VNTTRKIAVAVGAVAVAATSMVASGEPASTATTQYFGGSTPDLGGAFGTDITWLDRDSVSARVTLKDTKDDGHHVYFYFIINKGWSGEWQGQRRENHEGPNKSVTWYGISAHDSAGIYGPTLRICTEKLGNDSCKEFTFDNPYFP